MIGKITLTATPVSQIVYDRRMRVLIEDLSNLYRECVPDGDYERDVSSHSSGENGLFVGDALEDDFTNQKRKHDPKFLRLYAIRIAHAKLIQARHLFEARRVVEGHDALIDAHFWHGSAVTLGPLEVLAASMQSESKKTFSSSGGVKRGQTFDPIKEDAKRVFLELVKELPEGRKFPEKLQVGRRIVDKLKAAGLKTVAAKTLVLYMATWTEELGLNVFED